jgi:hypothetical protein
MYVIVCLDDWRDGPAVFGPYATHEEACYIKGQNLCDHDFVRQVWSHKDLA